MFNAGTWCALKGPWMDHRERQYEQAMQLVTFMMICEQTVKKNSKPHVKTCRRALINIATRPCFLYWYTIKNLPKNPGQAATKFNIVQLSFFTDLHCKKPAAAFMNITRPCYRAFLVTCIIFMWCGSHFCNSWLHQEIELCIPFLPLYKM